MKEASMSCIFYTKLLQFVGYTYKKVKGMKAR